MRAIVVMMLTGITQTILINQVAFGQVNTTWAKSFSGTNSEVCKSFVADPSGNVYTCGYFTGTIDCDPGNNSFLLNSAGFQDVFITKLDANGQFVWAKQFGGSANDMVYSIALDRLGFIYTCGFFHGTVDFDPGNGVYNLNSMGANSQDVFISKLDSNGNFSWARQFGGSGYYDSLNNYYDAVSCAYALQADTLGNIYTAGSFLGTIDFNPGVGINNMASLSVSNIFISKLNSAGEFVWVKQMGENKHGDEAYSLFLDEQCNVYTCGVFNDTADFDPGINQFTLISNAYSSAFISKLDSSGNFIWAKKLGGNNVSSQSIAQCIRIDKQDDVVVSGIFKGDGDFDPGVGISNISSNGNFDIFIVKLSAIGDFKWVRNFGGIQSDYCYSLSIDTDDNIFTSGSFKGSVDFNPGINTCILNTSNSTSDIFLSKINQHGDFYWAVNMGGQGNDLAHCVLTDSMNNIYLSGSYSGVADFNPTNDIYPLVASGGIDGFILKLNQQSMILPTHLTTFSGIPVNAGNLLKWQTENEINANYFEIQRSDDAKNFYQIGIVECLANTSIKESYTFIDNQKSYGIVYYRLKIVDLDRQYTYSPIISLYEKEVELKIVAYPNPCKGKFNLLCSQLIQKGIIHIKNSEGLYIKEQEMRNEKSCVVDLSFYPNGYYILEMQGTLLLANTRRNEKFNPIKIEIIK